MIGRITGVLREKHPPQVLVETQGIAYEIDVPMSTFYNLPALGETISLYTHFVVREDAQQLFGFATDSERSAFRQLIKVSGVGAKIALAVLSGLSVTDLAAAIALRESATLVKVPGIGKKTAERLLLELRDKLLAPPVSVQSGTAHTAPTTPAADTLNALLALGYNDREAQWAIAALPSGLGLSDSIRQALKILSKQ